MSEKKILSGNVIGGLPVHQEFGSNDILTDPLGIVKESECEKVTRGGKDLNGIFTTVSFYDRNLALRKTSVLSQSGALPGLYDVRTVTYYNGSGVQIKQDSYTLSYDVDDDLISETLNV